LQANVALAHLAFDLGPGHEGGHRVDHHHIESTGANGHVGDLEGLLAGVGWGDEQLVDVHAERLGIDGIEGMLGVDKGGDAAVALSLGHDVGGEGGLAR